MSHPPELYQWRQQIASHFPQLSQPQMTGLALWSLGMLVVRSCSLTAIADWWSCRLKQPFQTVRERLRDLYREKEAKAGAHRAQLEVRACWAPWLGWVLERWSGTQVALALDATSLGQRFVVLAISVLYRGGAVPVAWKILKAAQPHAWRPEWVALLQQFRGLVPRSWTVIVLADQFYTNLLAALHDVPRSWTVIVLADRGLYAKWLFEEIGAVGWHPLLRVNSGGTFRPDGAHRRRPFTHWVPTVGSSWRGRGTAFSSKATRVPSTLLGYWGEGRAAPWLLLTDLHPDAAQASWYGLRVWIEQGFKCLKCGGWHWQHTRMTDPTRAERLWLPLAIATWWSLSVGGEAEAAPVTRPAPLTPRRPAAPVRGGGGWGHSGMAGRCCWRRSSNSRCYRRRPAAPNPGRPCP